MYHYYFLKWCDQINYFPGVSQDIPDKNKVGEDDEGEQAYSPMGEGNARQ